ncbi:MAG: hypothetical protein QGD90_01295 [Candidatus Hydrogenedentes bacterium]|nr:hypothetical protein [Candidatus Hydrogenedentota bacterium]
MTQTTDKIAESGLGKGERSALLGPGLEEELEAMNTDFSLDDDDPTQQLLLALGHFQRILRDAQAETDELWSDECMNQLILGVEISLAQSWTQLVEAFTDAGRVLQTYESAGRARDALPFLDGTYDILCGIVGEVMGGGLRPQVLDKWQEHYMKALEAIKSAGLSLMDDGDAEDSSKAEGRSSTRDEAMPFEFPQLDADGDGNGDQGSELPALDELPPLENVLPLGAGSASALDYEAGTAAESEPSTSAESPEILGEGQNGDALGTIGEMQELGETVAQSDPDPSGDGAEPSKVIVDIVDRICDELAELNDRSPENRILAMEMIEGGISALKREADKDGYEISSKLCKLMKEACTLMAARTDSLDERFTEICFAFCGVFVEAMDGSDSENVRDWSAECKALIKEWVPADAAPQAVELEAGELAPEEPGTTDIVPAETVEAGSELGESIEEEPALDEAAVQEPSSDAAIAEESALGPEGSVGADDLIEEAWTAMALPELGAEPVAVDSSASQALFERAQRALAAGDAESAKSLALQAAASIAGAEVAAAEQQLQESEKRLKASLDSTVGARGSVKESEKMVKSGASQVTSGERALGEAKERTASVAQELAEEEEGVAELEAVIAELEAKREEGLEKVAEDHARLNEAKGNESSVAERLDGLRSAEVEARKALEASRQHVKDLQRTVSEVELQMERAREALTKHKMSLEDIRQTIGVPAPKEALEDEPPEELLF